MRVDREGVMTQQIEPYVVGWTVEEPWWRWASLFAACALLWPLRLAAVVEAGGRALADWVESP